MIDGLNYVLIILPKLTTHGYNTPFEALRDKTQSILTQIVAHRKSTIMSKQ